MNAQKTLLEYKQKIDPEMESFFKKVISENKKIDKNIAEALDCVRKITMSGGKRARAAFMYYGYLAAGGSEKRKIIRASISIELIHSFLLIHDDIIDQDSLRHGVVTTHEHYRKIAKKVFPKKNASHFGNSIAIIAGDLTNSLSNNLIFESKFHPELIAKALKKMQDIIFATLIGETEDVMIEYQGKATEKEILRMYKNKTAKYTIEGPLHLGAILAGADDKFLQALSAYAIPAGIAFQIQDDILGVFGATNKTGKPIDSDIRQGKQTILVAKALESANNKQKAILKKCLGNSNLSKKDLADFKKVIIDTESLNYAQNLANKMINDAKNKISKVNINPKAQEFLINIADYMLNREV